MVVVLVYEDLVVFFLEVIFWYYLDLCWDKVEMKIFLRCIVVVLVFFIFGVVWDFFVEFLEGEWFVGGVGFVEVEGVFYYF